MARLPSVPTDKLDPYFRNLVELDILAGRDPSLNAVMAHHAEFFAKYFEFFYPAHERGVLETRVKELARLRIARLNDCRTCSMARYESATAQGLDESCIAQLDVPEEQRQFSERERLAVEFAERMALDHQSIDDEFVAQLRTSFTEPEILELGMMIGQYIGFGRLLVALGIHRYSERPFVPGKA